MLKVVLPLLSVSQARGIRKTVYTIQLLHILEVVWVMVKDLAAVPTITTLNQQLYPQEYLT